MPEQRLSNFSLNLYYSGGRLSWLLDAILIVLLVFFVLYTPLPYGSVQFSSVAIIEFFSLACFLLWIVKLTLCGRQDELGSFRELYQSERTNFRQVPFFNRHVWVARFSRLLTLGKWPRKNIAPDLVQTEEEPAPRRLPYFSLFGFPVKNTGIEIAALLLLALIAIQLFPLPAILIRVLSPATSDLYRSAAKAAGTTLYFHPLSTDVFATFSRLVLYTSYLMIYVVVVNNIRTRQLFMILLYAIFLSAVFQGVYGLYEFLSGNQQIFGYKKRFGLDSASGTFINRNHYAAYLELSLPLLISLVSGRISQLRAFRGNLFVRIAHALDTEGSQIILVLLMIVLVSIGLVFSLSRSGISFCILSLIAYLFLYRKARERLSGRTYLYLGIAGTVAMAIWIGLDPLLERFLRLNEELEAGARWPVYRDTFRMFLHFPLAGTGAGTFDQVFPMYRTFATEVYYRYAHNDYLQLFAETGLFSIFLLISVGDLILDRLGRVLRRHFNRLSIVQIGAFCALFSFALHSFTDFSFQIPAIAVLGTIILGILFSHYQAEKSSHA